MIHKVRTSKRNWYLNGGFANPDNYRRMRGGAWTYWFILR